jgi:sensor domain CHASE-containing protein
MPVFLKNEKGKIYWGQISMVLMQDVLFREVKLHNGSFGLKISLQEKKQIMLMANTFSEALQLNSAIRLSLMSFSPMAAGICLLSRKKGGGIVIRFR